MATGCHDRPHAFRTASPAGDKCLCTACVDVAVARPSCGGPCIKRGAGPRPPVQRTTLDWNVVQFPSASFRAKGGGGTRESVPSVMAACQSNSGSHTIARPGSRTWGHKPFGTQGLHVLVYCHAVLACSRMSHHWTDTTSVERAGCALHRFWGYPGTFRGGGSPPGPPRSLVGPAVHRSSLHDAARTLSHCPP